MLIPSHPAALGGIQPSLSRRVNANSQRKIIQFVLFTKLIKKGEC